MVVLIQAFLHSAFYQLLKSAVSQTIQIPTMFISCHDAWQMSTHTNRLVRFFRTEKQVKMVINSSWLIVPVLDDFSIVKELTLNIDSDSYSLPEFVKQMSQLEALSITGCNDYPSMVDNLSLLECLSNLRKIRLQHVSVSSIEPIFALRNLKHLSFVMCEIGDAFMSYSTQSPHMLPNLTDLEIDTCSDLKQLPSELCNLVRLQKLTIANCHELVALPKGLGGFSNLEMLSLRCCTKLQELPESIGGLYNLKFLDMSDCLSVTVLPEDIGELYSLRVLKMCGCGGLQELPVSMSKLGQLEEVICDEETSYLWMEFGYNRPDLKINVVEDDKFESFMKIVEL